jgi:hypothetical protein
MAGEKDKATDKLAKSKEKGVETPGKPGEVKKEGATGKDAKGKKDDKPQEGV